MHSSKKTMFKNASALMISQIITWSLSLALMVFLPRYLGAAASGQLAFAYSLWAIAGVLISFGMDTYLTKEISRHPERTSELVGTSVILRVLFFILSFSCMSFYVHMMKYPPITITVVYLVGISVLLGQISITCQSVLYGLERMEYVSFGVIAGKLVSTVLGITLLIVGYRLFAIAIVGIIAMATEMLMVSGFLHRQHRLRLRFRLREMLLMIKASTPYLLSALIVTVYFETDVLLLSILVNETEVGWYSVAMRLTATFMFFPSIFTTVLFPVIARRYADDREGSFRVMRRSFDLMLLIGVPIGLGVLSIAKPLVLLLFGSEFEQSGMIVMIMGAALIFTYLSTMFGRFVIATDRVNQWTMVIVVAVIATIVMDIYLIPWCHRVFGIGAMAGAISYLLTEFGMVATGILLLPRGTFAWSNVRTAVLSIGSGAVMVLACWWAHDMLLPITIAIGACTYISLILLTRAIPREEIDMLMEVARNLSGRFRRPKAESPGITGV